MPLEQVAHQRAAGIVERGERLIEQPQRRVAEAEPRKRRAALLPGRQLLTRRELVTREPHAVEQRR